MKRTVWALAALALAGTACESQEQGAVEMAASMASGFATAEEAGAYLTTIAGCHDCHTPRFMEIDWQVPQSEWLTGSTMGWRGPWGTTYAPNLRLTVQNMSEGAWVEMLRTRESLPPMPWANTNRMREDDMRAIYRYLKDLGPAGQPVPAMVPPDQEPAGPYVVLAPPQGVVGAVGQ